MVSIVLFARSWQALVAVRALGKAGITVITADTEKFATSFFSKYSKSNFTYPDPDKYESKFISKIIAKSKYYQKMFKEEVVILPIHKETFTISKYKDKLSKHAKLCIDDYPKILKVHNKASVVKLLKKYRIRHPRTFLPKDLLELYKIVPKMHFPVFIKLRESAASQGLWKIDKRDELIFRYSEIVSSLNISKTELPILQEAVPGRDYNVAAILNKGKLRAIMSYKNVKTYPCKGGTGVYRKNADCPNMESQAKKLLRAIKWHGVIELDFRMGTDGNPYFIEANPRFWGGLNQSVASKINYPLLAYEIATKGDTSVVSRYDQKARTENLVTALGALMDEIQTNEDKRKDILKLYSYWKRAFKSKEGFVKNMDLFFKQLRRISKKGYDRQILREFIQRRKLVKDDILDSDDPFVVMGILYPINLFLKYGKVTKKMLTGEGSKENES